MTAHPEADVAARPTLARSSVQPWELRFRARRHTLPAWAKRNPERCLFVSDASGTYEVYAWNRSERTIRQLTSRANGTLHSAIESTGDRIWWFDDTDGDEFGVWMRQPFGGGPSELAAPELGPAWPCGLAMGRDANALVGRFSEDEGTTVHVVGPDGHATEVYRHSNIAQAIDLSRDLSLIALEHSEHGDPLTMRIRLLGRDGSTCADLADDEGLKAAAFAPVAGDSRLLALHRRHDRWQPFLFDARSGDRFEIELGLLGDVDVSWFADGSSLLVCHDHQARSQLYRYDLATGALTTLNVPPGTIHGARARPDGSVWYLWSSSAIPPTFASTAGDPGLPLPGLTAPASVPVEDEWVEGQGGAIHVLVNRPPHTRKPLATVFLLHGGPDDHDTNEFDPEVAAWVDHGFAVVRVNYRGSTGYGKCWTEAAHERLGLIELEDVGAVRRWAVATGVADPQRLVLAGASWGGYLTLLGVGTQPGAWAVALAHVPIADYVSAYEDEVEELKAIDRAMFGGSPAEVPDRYRASSPITYADAVRTPVFVTAAVNDPRCPIRQVERYVSRVAGHGGPIEFHRYRAGHDSAVVDDRVDLFRRRLAFVRSHLASA